LSLRQILTALISMLLKEQSMAIGSTIAHRQVVTGSTKNLVTAATGSKTTIASQQALG
jgi:hypothetical protein